MNPYTRGGHLCEHRLTLSPQLLPAEFALYSGYLWNQKVNGGCQLSLTLPPWRYQASLVHLSSLAGPLCRRCDNDSDNDDAYYLIITCFILTFYCIYSSQQCGKKSPSSSMLQVWKLSPKGAHGVVLASELISVRVGIQTRSFRV